MPIWNEGGLYLKPHDVARIWYLFLRDGLWESKQIVTREWVKESIRPSVSVPAARGASGLAPTGIQYGYKWWLRHYGDDRSRYAWCGSGFGGQLPVAIAEYDLIAVFTGWNIADGKPFLPAGTAIDRIVRAVAVK